MEYYSAVKRKGTNQATRKPGWMWSAHCYIKEASLINVHMYDSNYMPFRKRQSCRDDQGISGCQRQGRGKEGCIGKHGWCFVWGNYSAWDCCSKHMILSICQNVVHSLAQRINLMDTNFKKSLRGQWAQVEHRMWQKNRNVSQMYKTTSLKRAKEQGANQSVTLEMRWICKT